MCQSTRTLGQLFCLVRVTLERLVLTLIGAALFLAASWCLLGSVAEFLASTERATDPARSLTAAALHLLLSMVLFSAFRVAAGPALLAGFRRILAASGLSR